MIFLKRILTTYHDGEDGEIFVFADEEIENDAGSAADEHGAKEWCPALTQQGLDFGVPHGRDETCAGHGENDDHDCEW